MFGGDQETYTALSLLTKQNNTTLSTRTGWVSWPFLVLRNTIKGIVCRWGGDENVDLYIVYFTSHVYCTFPTRYTLGILLSIFVKAYSAMCWILSLLFSVNTHDWDIPYTYLKLQEIDARAQQLTHRCVFLCVLHVAVWLNCMFIMDQYDNNQYNVECQTFV